MMMMMMNCFCGMVDRRKACSLINALSGLRRFLATKSPLK